ncbi:hypothetical protein BH09ACT8_BH09ACT8_25640 [soil metagenome]
MADFGRRSQGGDSLDAIARTDQLLDAIAAERRVPPADAGEADLFALLGEWRDEVRWPPATDLVSERDAAAALRDGVNSMPAKRGGHRALTIVASLAAAVLCIGGFGAVVSGAGPGDPLYGLRTTLLGEPQQVRDDRVALAAQTEMQQVQTLIDNGQWEQAQQKLATVSDTVKTVDDTSTKQQLIDQWNQLAVKVDQQDPAATVPPSAAPGPLEQWTLPSELPQISLPETLPPLPDLSLPPLPSELPSFTLPSTLPSFTLPSTLPSMTLPSSLFPSPGSASAVPAPQQSVGAPPAVGTTTSAPTPSTPTSTSSAPTSESSSAPSSTTQSQAPQVVTTTTAAASTPAPSSAVTTTAAAAPRVAESQTVAVPAAPTAAQTAPKQAPDEVTTTMPQPILQLPSLGGN